MYVKQSYESQLRWNDLILGDTPFGSQLEAAFLQKFGIGRHTTLKQLEKAMGADIRNFETLALVRHPETRIRVMHQQAQRDLEAHASNTGQTLEQVKQQIRQQKGPPHLQSRTPMLALARTETLDQYIENLIELSTTTSGVSLLSYAHWLRGEKGNIIDRWFQLESMHSLQQHLEQLAGKPIPTFMPMTKSDSQGLQHAFHLSKASRDLLRQTLKFDYETFGYERDPSFSTQADSYRL